MSYIRIDGGISLEGEIKVQGSKNAVLPIMAASILNSGICILEGCPHICDVDNMLGLLKECGCKVSDDRETIVIDAKEIIPLLERLADTIEDEANLQLFITRANVVTMNLDYFTKKYEGQPEYYYESFKKLMDLNRYIKTVADLRREAVTYQRYLSYQSSGSIYNPENINQQLQYLLEEINTAVVMLKQEY